MYDSFGHINLGGAVTGIAVFSSSVTFVFISGMMMFFNTLLPHHVLLPDDATHDSRAICDCGDVTAMLTCKCFRESKKKESKAKISPEDEDGSHDDDVKPDAELVAAIEAAEAEAHKKQQEELAKRQKKQKDRLAMRLAEREEKKAKKARKDEKKKKENNNNKIMDEGATDKDQEKREAEFAEDII